MGRGLHEEDDPSCFCTRGNSLPTQAQEPIPPRPSPAHTLCCFILQLRAAQISGSAPPPSPASSSSTAVESDAALITPQHHPRADSLADGGEGGDGVSAVLPGDAASLRTRVVELQSQVERLLRTRAEAQVRGITPR